jgi:hypothetical protein
MKVAVCTQPENGMALFQICLLKASAHINLAHPYAALELPLVSSKVYHNGSKAMWSVFVMVTVWWTPTVHFMGLRPSLC